MGVGERRQKDSAMAATLKSSPVHKGDAVERRKDRNYHAFLAQFSPKLTGSAAYRRLMAKRR